MLEPAHGFLLADAVLEANASPFPFLIGDAEAGSAQNLQSQGTKSIKSVLPDLLVIQKPLNTELQISEDFTEQSVQDFEVFFGIIAPKNTLSKLAMQYAVIVLFFCGKLLEFVKLLLHKLFCAFL